MQCSFTFSSHQWFSLLFFFLHERQVATRPVRVSQIKRTLGSVAWHPTDKHAIIQSRRSKGGIWEVLNVCESELPYVCLYHTLAPWMRSVIQTSFLHHLSVSLIFVNSVTHIPIIFIWSLGIQKQSSQKSIHTQTHTHVFATMWEQG